MDQHTNILSKIAQEVTNVLPEVMIDVETEQKKGEANMDQMIQIITNSENFCKMVDSLMENS